ncbi:hypothetical protein BDZ94DRAFT_738933 [Collybia nuda]|uniref:Uncharacterized protein n=1 Tax=Collybia nuda TaxID=64659 RepID=A0A9P5Y305_9AGAR|nr:hypothetical protein BDZ94DRAFT_738933 [Collybia nuda]
MVQPEKRLLWHPRQENKFVVGGGSQITLYEWAPDYPEIRQITSQHDLQHMKCFAWSPDPGFEDLVAVGHSTGKIDLLRLESSKHGTRSNSLSTGPVVTLPMRNSRSCNSLAFCTANPSYLASGLDKIRGDHSLVVWDISTTTPVLALSPGQSQSSDTGHHPLPPRRPHQPIPRAETGPRTDSRILQQHAQTETVTSVCFLPQSTTLLLAGISHRWLRLFDIRSAVPSTTNAASKIQGLATDPFDPHRIASFGDGLISLWDSRKLSQTVMSFTEKEATADGAFLRPGAGYTGIEFSATRRGTLAALERDSSYVRFWDVMSAKAHIFDDGVMDGRGSRELGRASRRSWANLPWPSTGVHHHVQQSPKEPDLQPSLVLTDTRRTKRFSRALASFALVPSPQRHPLTSNVMVVNKEGDLELYALHDTPKQAIWSARGDLAISAGQMCRVLEGFPEMNIEVEQWEGQNASQYTYSGDPHSSHSQSQDRSESATRGRSKPSKDRGPVVPAPPTAFPPFFGRGDEEGFPALTSPVPTTGPTNLAATRPKKGRDFSPADFKHHDLAQRNNNVGDAKDDVTASGRRRKEGGDDQPSRSVTRGRRLPRGVNHVVEDDISMVMKRRALKGYGLSKPQANLLITQDDHKPTHGASQMLPDLWAWISHSHEFFTVPSSILHGYDFAYQGLQGIWEGLQPLPNPNLQPESGPPNPYLDPPAYYHERRSSRHNNTSTDDAYGNFQAALSTLAARRPGDRSWKPSVSTTKVIQRQIALQLCGWSLRDEELNNFIKRWEKDGEISRAACWLVFTKQYTKAIDLLMRSNDEIHRMMSGTVAALVPHSSSSKSPELRDHCERLIVRLHDPYFRVLLTHLALNDWLEILEEETMPFRERLAIAFLFLDDKAVSSYLRRCMDRALSRGDIDGVMIPGLSSKAGLDILQGYLDRTGDVQSVAILGSYVCPPGWKNPRLGPGSEAKVERWVESYRDLLDGFKMFHCRVGFDIERGQVTLSESSINAGGGDWVPRQILIRCNYCNKPISADPSVDTNAIPQKAKPTACPHCNRTLPRCSICLMTLEIVQDAARELDLLHSQNQYKDTIDEAIIMCQTCRHGGHASHILDWFYAEDGARSHGVCAVADCDCRCAEEM